MYIFVMVFLQYLRIGEFVWALALLGTRYYQCASVDCSGTIQKIHMRKIRLDQGIARACHHDGFHHLGPFDKAPWTVQSPGVCADAQCCKITWLEEIASDSNTIQAQEDITQPGKTAGKWLEELASERNTIQA